MGNVESTHGHRRGSATAEARAGGPAGRRNSSQAPRERMVAAMLELVGEQGYADTSVADVIMRAGASRKTFYEHFEDKRACLFATAEEISERWLRRIERAIERGAPGVERVEAFVGELFQLALASSAELRVLAVELTAAGQPGIERRELFLRRLAALLTRALGGGTPAAAESGEALEYDGRGPDAEQEEGSLRARALVGAIVRIPYARALNGSRLRRPRRAQLLGLAGDVARWAGAYGSAAAPTVVVAAAGEERAIPRVGGRAPGTLSLSSRAEARRGLPRGEGNVSRSFVVHSQRERLLDALANLSAAKGYSEVTIPEIVSEAAVSVQAFYEHFAGRDDAFAVAYEIGHRKALAIVERAYEAQPDWRTGVCAAIDTLLEFLASEPSFAHLALVDALTATPRAPALALAGLREYAELLRPGFELRPSESPLAEVTIEASAAAVQELCFVYIVSERARELPALAQLARHVALTPFVGGESAAA